MIECIVPIIRVVDLDVSVPYYSNILGFKIDWREGGMVGVSRDGKGIMLCEGEQGHLGSWTWIGVQDATAVFDEFSRSGASINHPPLNYPWALEFKVTDPDGNVLRFGSDSIPGRPFDDWRE